MRLEEGHSKQTPKLNKREWSLHQTQPKSTSWFFVTHLYNSHTNNPSSCPLRDITLSPDHKAQPSRSASGANTLRKVNTDLLSSFSYAYSPYTKPLTLSIRKQPKSSWHSPASAHPSSTQLPPPWPWAWPWHHGLCATSAWFLPLQLLNTFTWLLFLLAHRKPSAECWDFTCRVHFRQFPYSFISVCENRGLWLDSTPSSTRRPM